MVYLTTQEKKPLPTHVKINSSKYPSTVLCEQIDTVNKDKVGDYIGQCSMAEMKKIDAALAVSIGIGINIKSNDLVKKWAEAANEAVKPDEKEPEPIAEKVEMPDIECNGHNKLRTARGQPLYQRCPVGIEAFVVQMRMSIKKSHSISSIIISS